MTSTSLINWTILVMSCYFEFELYNDLTFTICNLVKIYICIISHCVVVCLFVLFRLLSLSVAVLQHCSTLFVSASHHFWKGNWWGYFRSLHSIRQNSFGCVEKETSRAKGCSWESLLALWWTPTHGWCWCDSFSWYLGSWCSNCDQPLVGSCLMPSLSALLFFQM